MGIFMVEEFIKWWEIMFYVMFFESDLMFGVFLFLILFVW